jgi:hypothetical protein
MNIFLNQFSSQNCLEYFLHCIFAFVLNFSGKVFSAEEFSGFTLFNFHQKWKGNQSMNSFTQSRETIETVPDKAPLPPGPYCRPCPGVPGLALVAYTPEASADASPDPWHPTISPSQKTCRL